MGITIGSIAATLSVDLSSRAWPHWIGLFTWFVTVLLLEVLTIKVKNAATYISGEPIIVIMNGQIMEKAMLKARYNLYDLLGQLRNKNVFDLNQIAYAVLEKDGQISVLLKEEYLPVSRKDLNIKCETTSGVNMVLIFNGLVIEHNLRKKNLDRKWLNTYLKEQGLNSPGQVFLLTVDEQGNFYCDRYEDKTS